MSYHFCTYFDKNYLLRGLTLFRSLQEHCEVPFNFYVLCLDDETFDALNKLAIPNIVLIVLADVEQWNESLLAAKQNRSMVEYYFTLSPIFPLYLLEHFAVDVVTYLDADLMFFSSPKTIYDELGECSIFITEHRFSATLKSLIKYGRFNVQCQSFRNDEVGLRCLHRWRDQCLEWCYDTLENGKFADQKYLDEWPELYGDQLAISQHPGIGVAPWNVATFFIRLDQGIISIDDRRLIFCHFAGFSLISPRWFITGARSGMHIFQHAPMFRCYALALHDTHRILMLQGLQTSLYSTTRYKVKRWKALMLALLGGGLFWNRN